MGDVADILGLGGPPPPPAAASGRASPVLGGPLGPLQENKRGKGGAVPLKKAGKPQGVSREVYALLGSEGLPPEVWYDIQYTIQQQHRPAAVLFTVLLRFVFASTLLLLCATPILLVCVFSCK